MRFALLAAENSRGLLRRRVQLGQLRTKRAMSSFGTLLSAIISQIIQSESQLSGLP